MGVHTIGRLRLLLSSSARLAPLLPNACSRWFHQRLRDDLGHLMTRLEHGADVCIEQLVLDLGSIPSANWEPLLHQRLLDALQAALRERLVASAWTIPHIDAMRAFGSAAHTINDMMEMHVSGMDNIAGHSALYRERNDEQYHTDSSQEDGVLSGRSDAITMPSLEMLHRYLLHGYAEPALRRLLDEGGMVSWWCHQCQYMPQKVAALLHECAVAQTAGRRLRHMFSGSVEDGLALAVGSAGRTLRYRKITGGQHGAWHQRSVRNKAFSAIAPRYFFSTQVFSAQLAFGSHQRLLDRRFLARLHAQLPGVLQKLPDEHASDANAEIRPQPHLPSASRVTAQEQAGRTRMPALPIQKRPVLAPELAVERYQVDNAGLILLWPLLPGLFRRWGLLEKGQFIDADAQEQAICRLDSWLWQSRQPLEWRMVLTKVLCGWPMAQVLARNDQDEGLPLAWQDLDALLRDLAAQTPGLQRCDQEDIRHGFLQRTGTLSYENQRWHLQVEPDASDVLLGQLPWPVSQVSLPWLDAPVEVTWF